ncbi:MAG: flagellin FliC3 [Lachnospiraceae bacterium]|nr:flagellin FliC3 [Lachnospiraceae bacterium]MDE7007899.1 flagellin FliC3 [Lachnospiraceae bacterium]
MKINFNASAVIANNALQRNDNRLQESLQRLSSGLKIVNAKDNPSGLAMSKRMNAQIEGLNMATQNAGDGISVIEIADGAMSEIHDMLHRINELAVKSSTGTMTDDDRQMIQTEVEGLQDEITRIVSTTEFNGQTLLDGTFDLKGYTDNVDVKVVYYGDALGSGEYTIGGDLNITYKEDGTIDTVESNGAVPDEITIIKAPNETINAKISKVNGNVITIEGDNDFELKLRVPQKPTTPPDPVATATYSNVKMELEGFGAMDTQIGANEGQQLGIRIPAITLDLIGIADLDMKTQESARESLGKMGDAVKYVSAARSRLGAYQNRLEHTINSLDISVENMTAAYSRIMDLDMAEEMTEYTTLQVLSQASTSMLAQANERPSQVLQLLQ